VDGHEQHQGVWEQLVVGHKLRDRRMSRLDRLLDGLPQSTTVKFFATFARFEFALMRCNYLRRVAEALKPIGTS
jgi:hypothetical protein